MNNIFVIKNNLTGEDPSFPSQEAKFTQNDILTSQHIDLLINNINDLIAYWKLNQEFIDGSILSVNYFNLVPKSKRIKYLFKGTQFDNNIVGAKYNYYENNIGLSIVYKSDNLSDFEKLKSRLLSILEFVSKNFDGEINSASFKEKNESIKANSSFSKSQYVNLLLEVSRIRSFWYPEEKISLEKEQVIKFYIDPAKLKKKLNIHVLTSSVYDRVALLDSKDLEYLSKTAPYLICQGFEKKYENPTEEDDDIVDIETPKLEGPHNEMYIGQIDSAMFKDTYLEPWVVSEDLRTNKDYKTIEKLVHGTKVCSILVHGGDLNDSLGLNDNCGHFKVKHFAVLDDYTDVFEIVERVEKIVRRNYKQVKVWNLSLGTNSEIPQSFISPLASLLDTLQAELDVIFVVSATNKPKDFVVDDNYRIGSPADSINSLVVASARMTDKKRATYSRKGGVLDFFIKPDLCCYGGDSDKYIYSYNGCNIVKCRGTSYAAPFIARKLAFLIYTLGLSREEAKALLIHSAAEWKETPDDVDHLGRGIVFSDIRNILTTPDDEIRFIFKNNTKAFYSENYSLPIPLNASGKSPFSVKATMCYFTSCSANCGVDYTNTEVDFKFGPVLEDGLHSIKDNGQYDNGKYINEKMARDEFCKWDNVKHIYFAGPKTERGLKSAEKWGFKLTTSYRNGLEDFEKAKKYNFPVGIVVTLKSCDGSNRAPQFRRNIERSQWTIEIIDVNNLIDISTKLKQKINFKN